MKLGLFLLPLAAIAMTAASAQIVEVGTADWDNLPRARVTDNINFVELGDWIEKVVESKACRHSGMRPHRWRIDEPYAVLLEPDGTVKRIVVHESACPGVDFIVGLTLQALSKKHKFRPTGQDSARWFGGRIDFGVSPQSED